jgi:hypothetical protein
LFNLLLLLVIGAICLVVSGWVTEPHRDRDRVLYVRRRNTADESAPLLRRVLFGLGVGGAFIAVRYFILSRWISPLG